MNPVMLCFLRFPRVFDLICHSEYLPSSKVPLSKSTHRSFWAICLTFTSSFHLRSPRTTCRREPGNSAFIWTTQPSNEQIFTPKFDLWVGHGQILDVHKFVKVRLVTCDFSPFSDAKIGSGPTCHPSPCQIPADEHLQPRGGGHGSEATLPKFRAIRSRSQRCPGVQIWLKTQTHGEY